MPDQTPIAAWQQLLGLVVIVLAVWAIVHSVRTLARLLTIPESAETPGRWGFPLLTVMVTGGLTIFVWRHCTEAV